MAETSYPHDNTAIATETQWSNFFGNLGNDGVIAAYALELQAFGDSSGRQVKLNTGRALVGSVFYENDATLTLAIAANASGNPRIDRLAIKLDRAANTARAVIVQGTPAGSPAAPALTNTSTVQYIQIAQVAVANGATTINSGDVTDERDWHYILKTVRFFGVLNGSGVGAITHRYGSSWVQKIVAAQAIYKGNSGEAIPFTISSIDGAGINVTGGGASKNFYVSVTYCEQTWGSW